MARKSGSSAVMESPETAIVEPVSMLATKGKPCPKLSPADFWRASKAYPRGAGTHYKLYRLYPMIDRRLSSETKKDIDNQPEMDDEYILTHHGSGDYQIYFLDSNGRPVSLAVSTLEYTADFWEHPPILNQAELVEGHPKNKSYIEGLKARGFWRRDQQQQEQNNMASAEAVGAASTAVTELAGIAKSAMARSGEKQPADAALSQVVDMMGAAYKTALSNINESGGGGKSSADGGLMLVVKMMQDQQKQQHEVFMELLKQQGGRQQSAPASIDGQLDVVTKMIEFAKSLGGSERPSSWMDRLPDLAVPLLSGLMQRAAAPPAMPLEFAPPAPVSLPVVGVPAAAAPQVAPMQSAPPAVPEVNDAMMPMILTNMGVPPDAIPVAVALIKHNIAGRAVQMFRGGASGYAFAAEVERTEGSDAYGLVHGASLAGLLGLLMQFSPVLGAENAAMIASPQFQAWLGDFFAYGQANGYAEDESSDAEPAAADPGAAE